jgi:hypothetical protein
MNAKGGLSRRGGISGKGVEKEKTLGVKRMEVHHINI